MFPLVPSGSSGVTLASIVDGLSTDRNAAKADYNLNKRNIANAGLIDATDVYQSGVRVSSVAFGQINATPTSDPKVWNFITSRVGKVSVVTGGLIAPSSDYSITGGPVFPTFTNSGFETGDLTGWSGGGTIGITTVNPHVGSNCAYITSPNGAISQISSNALVLGTSYLLTVDVRGDSGTTAQAIVTGNDNNGASIVSTTSSVTTSWATISITFVATSTKVLNLSLSRGATGVGTVYFDNVVFYAPTSFVNSSFEAGLSNWSNTDYGVSSLNPHSGSKCGFIKTDNSYLYNPIYGSLVAGNVYRVVVWFRGDSNTTSTVNIQLDDGLGANSATYGPFSVTSNWSSQVFVFTATSSLNLTLLVTRNTGVGSVYIDDPIVSGGYATGTYTLTFVSGTEPFSGESVSIIGDNS